MCTCVRIQLYVCMYIYCIRMCVRALVCIVVALISGSWLVHTRGAGTCLQKGEKLATQRSKDTNPSFRSFQSTSPAKRQTNKTPHPAPTHHAPHPLLAYPGPSPNRPPAARRGAAIHRSRRRGPGAPPWGHLSQDAQPHLTQFPHPGFALAQPALLRNRGGRM